MAFKGFNEDTLSALTAQGVTDVEPVTEPIVQEPVVASKPDPDLPDLEFNPEPVKKVVEPVEKVIDVVEPGVKPVEPVVVDKVDPVVEPVQEPVKSLDDVLDTAGFDKKDLQTRIVQGGGFTDDIITELKGKIDPAEVDKFVQEFNTDLEEMRKITPKVDPVVDPAVLAKQVAQTTMNEFIYDSVGGEDNFKAMSGVLTQSGNTAEVAKINAKLRSTNKDVVAEGMKEAVSSYNKAIGRGGKLMSGDPGGDAPTTIQFLSKAEYHTIMKTDKYKTDPLYARKVDNDRLASRKSDQARSLPGQYYNQRNGRVYAM